MCLLMPEVERLHLELTFLQQRLEAQVKSVELGLEMLMILAP
jgi:hypothetical protein